MNIKKVCLMLIDSELESFSFFKEENMNQLPAIGEIVVVDDEEGVSYVYEVVQVIYKGVDNDVLLVPKGKSTDYLRNLVKTHTL